MKKNVKNKKIYSEKEVVIFLEELRDRFAILIKKHIC